MDEFDELVLDVLETIPERNPNGTDWKMYWGEKTYTKAQILRNYGKDMEMTTMIRKKLLRTQFHKASRKPQSSVTKAKNRDENVSGGS